MKTILKIVGAGVFIAGALYILNAGLVLHETHECLTWQEQAERFEGFYLTQWQAQQCEAVGVEVNAPIISATSK